MWCITFIRITGVILYKTCRYHHYQTILIKHPLEVYYLRQVGRGSGHEPGSDPSNLVHLFNGDTVLEFFRQFISLG